MSILSDRTRILREGTTDGKAVLYWMARDKRAADNWALIAAQAHAIKHNLYSCLKIEFYVVQFNMRLFKKFINCIYYIFSRNRIYLVVIVKYRSRNSMYINIGWSKF